MTCPKQCVKVLVKLGLESSIWGFWARFSRILWIFEGIGSWMDFKVSLNPLDLHATIL